MVFYILPGQGLVPVTKDVNPFIGFAAMLLDFLLYSADIGNFSPKKNGRSTPTRSVSWVMLGLSTFCPCLSTLRGRIIIIIFEGKTWIPAGFVVDILLHSRSGMSHKCLAPERTLLAATSQPGIMSSNGHCQAKTGHCFIYSFNDCKKTIDSG